MPTSRVRGRAVSAAAAVILAFPGAAGSRAPACARPCAAAPVRLTARELRRALDSGLDIEVGIEGGRLVATYAEPLRRDGRGAFAGP